jgi:hypothetical protein
VDKASDMALMASSIENDTRGGASI